MKIAVLGGLGLQGRAAVADLVASSGVEEVICVDTAADGAARLAGLADLNRVRFVRPKGPAHLMLADVMRSVDMVVADEARRLGTLGAKQQEQEILMSLGRFFGPDAAAPDALIVQDWGAEEWTGGCYAAHFPPNVWTTYGSAFRAPCGRIHWAGTETATEWHGYMEGALRSGRRAADEMLQADSITWSRP